ncbi:MAG: GNAT family N-acetyltransferase [Tannerella sp.]|jgi:diamine N-acetyltransferase|nr:GNAT family N-acetyltransferase [Tannerella sp.]
MKLLENERIRLRAPEPEDLDMLYRWENDTSLWESGNTFSPYSRYALKQYIAESGNDLYERGQLRLIIEPRETSVAVGAVDLYDIELHHRRAGTGILVDSACRQKGFATEALTLAAHYAFTFLRLHHLYAHIPRTNTPCLRLFERCGFATAGVLAEWLHVSGGYADVIVMSLINREPPPHCAT